MTLLSHIKFFIYQTLSNLIKIKQKSTVFYQKHCSDKSNIAKKETIGVFLKLCLRGETP